MHKHVFAMVVCSFVLFTLGGAQTGDQNGAAACYRRHEDRAPSSREQLAPGRGAWTTGGPYGGYVNSLAMAPTDPDVIYAATDWGVFKTTDGGDTWAKTGFAETLVWTVQVAPDDPDTVYVGTDDDGLYKTVDGGSNWTQKGLSGARVKAVAVDPTSASILYAATANYAASINHIYKGTDGGDTWDEKLSLPHETGGAAGVNTLLIDTDDSSHVYAGVRPFFGPNLYRSTDGGETWVPTEVSDGTWCCREAVALAMTPAGSDPAAVYTVIGSDDAYKSTDRGKTWQPTDTPYISPAEPWALAVDPSNPNTVYVGTWYKEGDLYKSTDAGATWSVMANGLAHGGPSSLVIDPRDGDALLVGLSEGGVYKSIDGGENWSVSAQGLSNATIRGLAVHPSSSDSVFAALEGEGHHLAATTNGGASWELVTGLAHTDLGAIAFDPGNPSTIWVGDGVHWDQEFFVHKSTDGGHSWTSRRFRVCFSCETGVSDILINPADSDSVLVGASEHSGCLARTSDGGQNWLEVGGPSYAVAADANHPGTVYTGKAETAQVFRYTDVWGMWSVTEITPADGIGDVRDIEVDSDSRVYVAASDGLWRWDGAAWTALGGLPSQDITALAIDRTRSPGVIYLGTEEDGVFVSEDAGRTWLPFGEGLGSVAITRLTIGAGQPRVLYAGTKCAGVWRRAIPASETPTPMPNRPFAHLPLVMKR